MSQPFFFIQLNTFSLCLQYLLNYLLTVIFIRRGLSHPLALRTLLGMKVSRVWFGFSLVENHTPPLLPFCSVARKCPGLSCCTAVSQRGKGKNET